VSEILKTTDEAPVLVQRHIPGTKYGDAGFVNPCWDLTADEYDELLESIRSHGFSPAFPIIRSAGPFAPGALIDGFHRQAVCDELGVEAVYVDLPFETEAAFRIAQIDGNLRRRHLPKVKVAVLVKEREIWAEQQAAKDRRGTRTDLGASLPTSPGRTTEKLAEQADMGRRTFEKYNYAWEHGDDFIREELESERRGADWGYKATKEWRDAEAETGQRWASYPTYRAAKDEQDRALDHQAQWDREYGELFEHSAGVDVESRTKGHDGAYVRAELEKLDRYWNSHAVVDGDVVDNALHTFKGVLVRWQERLADMLKVWDAR
jgi:ParB-like chromosome segregation protein Spo0J